MSAASAADVTGITLLIVCTVVLIINCIVNLALLDRYYPATVPSKRHRIWSGILFTLTLMTILLVFVAVAAGISIIADESNPEDRVSLQWVYALLLSVCAIIGFTGIYILWNQVSLRKALRRNYAASMESFLANESIIS